VQYACMKDNMREEGEGKQGHLANIYFYLFNLLMLCENTSRCE
jgi:hypothetical protein